MLQLASRADLTLDLVHRVAWRGEAIDLAPEARTRIAERRKAFEALLKEHPHLKSPGNPTIEVHEMIPMSGP